VALNSIDLATRGFFSLGSIALATEGFWSPDAPPSPPSPPDADPLAPGTGTGGGGWARAPFVPRRDPEVLRQKIIADDRLVIEAITQAIAKIVEQYR